MCPLNGVACRPAGGIRSVLGATAALVALSKSLQVRWGRKRAWSCGDSPAAHSRKRNVCRGLLVERGAHNARVQMVQSMSEAATACISLWAGEASPTEQWVVYGHPTIALLACYFAIVLAR
jgi:hypothetical protein